MLLLKLLGGALATVILLAFAPFANHLFGEHGVGRAIVAASLLPFVQAPENVGSTALLLHSRYDLRGMYQAGSAGLRLLAIVAFASSGVTAVLLAIVVAQAIASVVISVAGVSALRRFRRRSTVRSATMLAASARSSRVSLATGVISLRSTLVPLIVGVVASPTQVGLFRIAQAPQTGLAAASSPARLMLLTEQTRSSGAR